MKAVTPRIVRFTKEKGKEMKARHRTSSINKANVRRGKENVRECNERGTQV